MVGHTDYMRDSKGGKGFRQMECWQVSREEKALLTQILLEQPGKHRVSVRDEIRLPLL